MDPSPPPPLCRSLASCGPPIVSRLTPPPSPTVQIPGYELEQLAPDWRAVLHEAWGTATPLGRIKHACVRR